MDFSQALTEQLGALTEALDDPGTDLLAVLDVLADDVSAAVPSFLGLTMTLLVDGNPVTLTALDDDLGGGVRASLQLPLYRLTLADGSSVVFYAANPGAFVDLATDTRRLFSLEGQIILDGHLPTLADPTPPTGITGMAELSVVNVAIGILIDRGHTAPGARTELLRRATDGNVGAVDAARHVLGSTGTTGPGDPDWW